MSKSKPTFSNIKTGHILLKEFCYFSKEHDFVEIKFWENGEGFDALVDNSRDIQRFSLTYGEWYAIKKIIKKFENQ